MEKKQRILNNASSQRLFDWLIEIDMDQRELHDITNYTEQYISNIINGKRPMTLEFANKVSEATSQGMSKKYYNVEIKIRPQYLLCMDDIKTTEDFQSMYIHRSQAVNNASLTLLDESVKEVCSREGISILALDNIPELLLLQAQLRDYSDSLIWNYIKHRQHSHLWNYLDQISQNKEKRNNEND